MDWGWTRTKCAGNFYTTKKRQRVIHTEKANLGRGLTLQNELLVAPMLSWVMRAILSLFVGNFYIFGIFRVEAVITVQSYEVSYRQWRNFRPKMAVGLPILF